ncbi:putative protease [Staphylococcus piscifermentans]|uniref:Uncharacterized protein n=1 Tax=Staphylococcus piscifermentans TaxID=70258 RepID=A0A239UJ55_9STAP|nr:Ig-like domain-containing protein [Staphylococcus piscifermentans]RTX85652.1 LPXTG cell wall anchor domain-containing protein [Staphylococcus piscifermentans]GEP85335.1 hypothetical protein SPI02_19200 [Staphylococcus piscifermentans]SNV10000.1 putative protease [Staphylococcus piscifermentans]
MTYVLTDKGFTVNTETQADADRRYDEAIQGDTERLVLDIKAHPERDYRTKLFHVMQGVKFASPDLKTELEIILTPLAEKYYVSTPTIEPIEAGADTLSGKGDPESTITVTLPNRQIVKTEVDKDSNWKVQLPEDIVLKHNDVTLVKATGELGSVSKDVIVTAVDTQAPAQPVINRIEAGSAEINGTSEPESLVIITLPDNQKVESTTDKQGNWKVTLGTPLNHGQNVKAEAQDAAGNKSIMLSQIVEDTISPVKPVIQPIEAGTNHISGTSEPNSTVILSIPEGKTLEVLTDAHGNWEANLQQILNYNDEVKAVAKDVAGNTSSESGIIVKDTKSPAAPVIKAIEAGSTEISGASEPNSTVVITLPDNKVVEVQADAQGNWKATLPSVLHHNGEVSAIAKDLANNESSKATQIVKDTKAPTTPAINAIEAGSTEISGASEPNSTVIITIPGDKIVEVQADAQGNWKATSLSVLHHNDEVSAIAKDIANNESPKAIQIVKDTIAPAIPSIEPVKESDKKIVGLADPFTIIHVELSANSPILIEADASGKWEYYLNEKQKLEGNTLIKVFATDKAENKSAQNESLIEALKSTVVEVPVTEVEENLSEPTFEVTEEEIYEPLKLPEEENFEEETSEEFESTEMEQPEDPFATAENEEIENEELEADDEVNNSQTDTSLVSQNTDEIEEEFVSISPIILETGEEVDAEEENLNSEKNPLIENDDIYKENITCSDNENLDIEESKASITPVEEEQLKDEDDLIINKEDKEILLDKTITKEISANVFKAEEKTEAISQRKNKNSVQNLQKVKSKYIAKRSKSADKQDTAINKKLPTTGQDNKNILIGGLLVLLGTLFSNRRFKRNNKAER